MANAEITKEVDADLYKRAVELVTNKGIANISFVQRELKIGYNRAARLVEAMQIDGILGPLDIYGNRKVLVPIS